MKRRATCTGRARLFRTAAAVLLPLIQSATLAAQHQRDFRQVEDDTGAAVRLSLGAHAVPLLTHVSPILAGSSGTEAYLTQPTLLAAGSAFEDVLWVNAAVSLEGLTLDRGELGAGAYGEGYVDRRHPHTYLHELMLSAHHGQDGVNASVAAGRGFAPFGTDDPMMRPFVRFPVNHHLAHVLERLVLIGGARAGPLMIEAALFNGNEPLDARDVGSLERFGDSWSARLTLTPTPGIELQASRAFLVSPEFPQGGGWDQRKWSASARYDEAHAFGRTYALLEWNRTTAVDRDADVFSFGSVLAETAVDISGWRPAIRIERAERPEEERLSNPFRTPWPHAGGHVLAITRWTTASVRLERRVSAGVFAMAPFVEGSIADVTLSADGLFDPDEFYGSDRIWTVSVGARLQAGWHPARMGRYGVAAAAAPTHEH